MLKIPFFLGAQIYLCCRLAWLIGRLHTILASSSFIVLLTKSSFQTPYSISISSFTLTSALKLFVGDWIQKDEGLGIRTLQISPSFYSSKEPHKLLHIIEGPWPSLAFRSSVCLKYLSFKTKAEMEFGFVNTLQYCLANRAWLKLPKSQPPFQLLKSPS